MNNAGCGKKLVVVEKPEQGEFTKEVRSMIKTKDEDMCDKCRIKQLETNLKKRLEADIASACVIERLEREVAGEKEDYDRLHADFVERGREIMRLESQLKAKDEALKLALEWLDEVCNPDNEDMRTELGMEQRRKIEQALTPNSPEGQEVADEMIPR